MYPRRKKFFFPHQKVFFFSRSGTTADGSRQQQHKIGKNARS
jgi:hypothetical protein